MMFRDIVESVMLLNEDDWRPQQGKKSPGEDEILTEGMCEHDFQSRVFLHIVSSYSVHV